MGKVNESTGFQVFNRAFGNPCFVQDIFKRMRIVFPRAVDFILDSPFPIAVKKFAIDLLKNAIVGDVIPVNIVVHGQRSLVGSKEALSGFFVFTDIVPDHFNILVASRIECIGFGSAIR